MARAWTCRRAVEQPAAVSGQLQSRLVRPLRAARLRGRRRGALPARREAVPPPARRLAVRALRPDDCRRSNVTIGPARSPTGAAISLCWRRAGSASCASSEPGKIAGYLFYRPLPARVVIGPAVAESADDTGRARRCGRRRAAGAGRGHSRLGGGPAVLLRAFARGFRVDHLGNLMVAGPYRPRRRSSTRSSQKVYDRGSPRSVKAIVVPGRGMFSPSHCGGVVPPVGSRLNGRSLRSLSDRIRAR